MLSSYIVRKGNKKVAKVEEYKKGKEKRYKAGRAQGRIHAKQQEDNHHNIHA